MDPETVVRDLGYLMMICTVLYTSRPGFHPNMGLLGLLGVIMVMGTSHPRPWQSWWVSLLTISICVFLLRAWWKHRRIYIEEKRKS